MESLPKRKMIKLRIRKMETKKVKRDKAVLAFLDNVGTEGISYAFGEMSYMFDAEGLIDSLKENIDENMRFERTNIENNITLLVENLQEAGYRLQRVEDNIAITIYILHQDEEDVKTEEEEDIEIIEQD